MAKTIDLRSALGPVRNQGPFRGTCLAFAITTAHEHQRNDTDTLSVETLYWGAKEIDGDTASGTTFTSADQALRNWGQPPEHMWPYDILRDDQHPSYIPPPEAIDPNACHFAALDAAKIDPAAITDLLDAGLIVAIGTPTWRGLSNPIGSRLTNPPASDLDGGHHAMVIVGYRTDTNEVLLRNSWGISWGEQGHAWIPFAFITDHVVAARTIASIHYRTEPQHADFSLEAVYR